MGTSSTSSSGKLDITPDDPRWIGAWWGGFLLCGALLFLSALFMFGFPQALDEQDMDGGGESEQAMLPSSLTLEYQSSKPKGSIHGFDINSGLSVCEHLRGKKECRRSGRKELLMLNIVKFQFFSLFSPSYILFSFFLILLHNPFSTYPVIPRVTRHLLSNPVFSCITLAACMEIAVVAGFAAFLGKYLEQQFNLTTSSANQLLGRWIVILCE